jgi:hypothetical protein
MLFVLKQEYQGIEEGRQQGYEFELVTVVVDVEVDLFGVVADLQHLDNSRAHFLMAFKQLGRCIFEDAGEFLHLLVVEPLLASLAVLDQGSRLPFVQLLIVLILEHV